MSFANSRFNSSIRIDPKQKEWLRKHKVCRTMAGYLDIIINNYKKHGRKHEKQQMPNLQTADAQREPLGVRALRNKDDGERLQPVVD